MGDNFYSRDIAPNRSRASIGERVCYRHILGDRIWPRQYGDLRILCITKTSTEKVQLTEPGDFKSESYTMVISNR
jgi:hypothetical protein